MVSMHYLRQLYRGLQDCAYPAIETETKYEHHSSAQRGVTVSSNKHVEQALVSNSSVFAVLVVCDLFLVKSSPSIETDDNYCTALL